MNSSKKQKKPTEDSEFVKLLNMSKDNLLNPQITPEIIRESTNRDANIQGLFDLLLRNEAMKRQFQSQSMHSYGLKQTATVEYHPAFPDVELLPENRVGLNTLTKHIGCPMSGKFFLGRTISPATQVTGIMTLVEDPTGKKAVSLALYNFSNSDPSKTDFNDVLPPGTIIALKNPWFKPSASGKVVLRCDNPSHIEILCPKQVQRMIPGLTWKGEMAHFFGLPQEEFWSREGEEPDRVIGENLKKLGNKAFVEKRFTDSIRWYNLALEYLSEGCIKDVMSNRAAALLNLRCYRRALDDTEKVLEKDAGHAKAIYRKTKSLCGLRRYEEAFNFIAAKVDKHFKSAPNDSLNDLRIKAEKMAKDSLTGRGISYEDLMNLMETPESAECIENVIEYTGPVEIKQVPKIGRGMIATEDIQPGQQVLISKAFGIHKYKSSPYETKLSMNFGTSSVSLPGHDAVMAQIANKLYFEPESAHEVYSLFAGPPLGHLAEAADKLKDSLVDMKRIDRILVFNAHSCGTKEESIKLDITSQNSYCGSGLWIKASYMNHSCSEANCGWTILGDIMIVRAFKVIKKGEEILVSYIDPSETYRRRMEIFRSHELDCDCKLCKLDLADKKNGNETKRNNLIENLNKIDVSTSVGMKKAISDIGKLENLRKDYPQLNYCLTSPEIQRVAANLFVAGKYQQCVELVKKIHNMSFWASLSDRRLNFATTALRCYVALKKTEMIKTWIQQVKQDLMVAYGSIEPMRTLGDKALIDLLEAGIDFFDDSY
jgi:tetratricopeptide (TPR) repeat protein